MMHPMLSSTCTVMSKNLKPQELGVLSAALLEQALGLPKLEGLSQLNSFLLRARASQACLKHFGFTAKNLRYQLLIK
ncbi:MAG: hypothetical protein R2865_03150 [Deinococcales bacterium]